LSTGAKSLEDTLKRRSIVVVTKACRELNISLEKFTATLLESTEEKATSSSLQ
jgi:hypothetical protein